LTIVSGNTNAATIVIVEKAATQILDRAGTASHLAWLFVAEGRYDLHFSSMTHADPVILQTILDPRYTNGSALSVNVYRPEMRTNNFEPDNEGNLIACQ
jgi:hypothetical protein